MYYNFISLCMQCSMIFGQVVTTRCPACYSFNSKVVAWLLQPTFTTLLLGCHKVVTTKYPACYSCNSKVVSPRVQGCCMVVTTYFHKLVARLLLPCDKVIAWMLQPWHFYIYGMCNTVFPHFACRTRSPWYPV